MTEDIFACNRRFGELMTVRLCGVSHCDGSYAIRRRKADVHVFEYVIRGQGRILRGGRAFTARAGDAYWLRCGEPHDYRSSKSDPWEKIWFNISGPYVDALCRIYGLNRTVFPGCAALPLFREFISLVAGGAASPTATVLAGQKLLELVSFLAHYREAGAADDAETLRMFLDNRVREPVGLPEMSAFLHRSPSQVNRVFQKKFGVTPTRYLAGQRISLARTLLCDTGLSVRQVANELRFADEHYFSNVFKKEVGVSPLRYRQRFSGRASAAPSGGPGSPGPGPARRENGGAGPSASE